MSDRPQLWMLVGGNGAGKTTAYYKFLQAHGIRFINADLIAREISLEHPETISYAAAKIAEEMRLDLVDQRETFCYETVFSHPSKVDFVRHANQAGYEIIMMFIHLGDPQLNIARISQRVFEGGHFVPDEKVMGRLERLVKNVRAALPYAERAVIIDNSRLLRSFDCQLEYVNGVLSFQAESLRPWVTTFMNLP